MNETSQVSEQLTALADHLYARRNALLQIWRSAAEKDSELNSTSTLSRAQFNDHIPEVLDAFERKLTAQQRSERLDAAQEQKDGAAGHGLHRWQQGYNQREVMREWGHLHLSLVAELENYAAEHRELDYDVMPIARRALAQLCSEGVSESAAQYALLQQAEAAGRVRDLELALEEIRDMERERAEMLREATHDLRGNLGIVNNATALLNLKGVPEQQRAHFVAILQNSVTSLHALLNDLNDLARLEAGHEKRKTEMFDAGEIIRDMCANLQPLATEHKLFLKTEGPESLPVEGDTVKVQRIVQNLLLNAIKYTERGGIKVCWDASDAERMDRWTICVQDTGPGFKNDNVTPLARALKQATEGAQDVEEKAEEAGQYVEHTEPAPTLGSQSSQASDRHFAGEGIGLSIVKRLCELLDASLELETARGEGTTFRVSFPRSYS
jgi:signal transduction histidine kinase